MQLSLSHLSSRALSCSACLLAVNTLNISPASCAPSANQRSSNASVDTIHAFPNGTGLENLAIRASGEILATVVTAPELYQIDPVTNASATLVHSFSGYTSLTGIAEVESDQFYVIAGSISATTFVPVTGSYTVFHVDMSGFNVGAPAYSDEPRSVAVTKVADFPDGQLLNGLGLLSKERGLLYVADSFAGSISVLDVYTGSHYVAINNSFTAVPPGGGLGPNGVHVWRSSNSSYVYFSNSGQETLTRMTIHENGTASAEGEVIASGLAMDDFTLDDEGNVFQAVFGSNEVVFIDVNSPSPDTNTVTVLAGGPNSTQFVNPSSVKFGRTKKDEGSVYVTTNGGTADPATEVGGAVLRINL